MWQNTSTYFSLSRKHTRIYDKIHIVNFSEQKSEFFAASDIFIFIFNQNVYSRQKRYVWLKNLNRALFFNI